jgi:hypothetical protein
MRNAQDLSRDCITETGVNGQAGVSSFTEARALPREASRGGRRTAAVTETRRPCACAAGSRFQMVAARTASAGPMQEGPQAAITQNESPAAGAMRLTPAGNIDP